MPLILGAAISWAAGTATGLSGNAWAWTVAGALIALLAAILRRSAAAVALPIIFSAGAQLGGELHQRDARCLVEASRAGTWDVRINVPVTPGSFVRGELERKGCSVSIGLAVRSGSAEGGSVVRVTHAEPSAGERGVLLRNAQIVELHSPGPLSRWRNHVARELDKRFDDDAPIVRALLIADTRGLAADLKERYTDAGLVHILSISGLHVAIVGGALLLVFQALRFSANVARIASLVTIALYVLAIGAPPPAVRSATLFAAGTLARAIQRPVSPWGSYALGGLIPLLQPRTVLDLGWQLSLSGYGALIVATRFARRRLPEKWRGWKRTVARELIGGVLTTLATAPLVAWHFGRLSLVAAVSNLVAGPIVSVLQPALFLAMMMPIGAVADFVADASRPMLRALDYTAALFAAMPGAAVVVSPTRVVAVMSVVAVTAVLVAAWSRHWGRPLFIALSAGAAVIWFPDGLGQGSGQAEFHLIDVGQGDAIALRSPKGRWVLIDAGRNWEGGDAGRSTVVPHIRRRGGELAMLILSHPHADHIGGAESVLRALKPDEMRDAAFVEGSATYKRVLAAAEESRTRWQRVRPGELVSVDGLEVEFLAPDSAWTVMLDDPNEASTVVRARYGDIRILLTGDAEKKEEDWLLRNKRDLLRADILKLGHHGSATSSTADFVAAVAPRLALVSVGQRNMYGHPSPDVMRRLMDLGATPLRTDQLGTVILRTDGKEIEVEAGGARWKVAPYQSVRP